MTGTEVLQVIVQSIVIWVFISIAICSCIVITKRRDAAYYKNIESQSKLSDEKYPEKWSCGDEERKILGKRVWEVLEDNGVKAVMYKPLGQEDCEGHFKGLLGADKQTQEFFYRLLYKPEDVNLDGVYRFACEYGVSVDYLLGRSDRETL